MSYFTQISYADTGSLDAFSRLRISNPEALFATQTQYNSDSVQLETGVTGTGIASSYSTSTRMTALAVGAGTGTAFLQGYDYLPYQTGKSQLIATTFVIGTAVAGAVVDVGYFDANNGVIFRQNGTTNLQFVLRTSTGGSVSDANVVAQSVWNIDKFDGTGPSGITLDITKSQILFIDLQFLAMGRVRIGFDVNGVVYYAHQFLNANNLSVPYMQTATLPIGMFINATTIGSTKTTYFKCATVQSEGGAENLTGNWLSTPSVSATAGNATRVPILAIRPKTTFNGITNRMTFVLENINLFVTGNQDVFWELVIGGAYSGQTYADVNTTYSSFEYTSVPGAYTNLTGGIVIASGFMSRLGGTNNGNPINVVSTTGFNYPITLDRSGAVRALGTLTLLVQGLGGTSTCQASFNYREIS